MLIEFRVENFLSIQDEQVLSMVASSDNTFLTSHTNNDKKLKLLKSSVLYGANASGKSNIIKALAIMKKIVISSANGQRGDKLPIIPFLLGNEDNKSTKFEIIFIQNDTKYQYGFILNSEKILEEWLLVFGESNRAQKWFERIYNEKEEKYNYSFGAKFLGSKQLWENSTRDNALFLSVAIQLNNEQLKPVFDFFLKYIRVTCTDSWNDGQEVTIDILRQDKQKIISYLKRADLDIEDIVVEETELNKTNLMQENIPQEIKQMMQTDLEKGARLKKTDIKTIHTNQQGKQILFDMLELESQGTQKFFKLIGPWVEALEQGYTIVVDELNTHLHPLMTKFLVNLFHNEDLNKSNAQLIFTTHDTSILNQDVFRRDQIWFCEKQNKATKLYPLSDFKVRKDKTNLENDYLLGRFGALPYFKEILSFWSDNGN
ncbi:AAA family ATPase [Campylobacter jejuni]|uniref:AAA family ATPase n=1 Tax=Campylobacter sp. BCW_6465 TaxID=1903582 RepID=UPI000874967A|nr:ATP-binding protein [Campylobacter sp. BCW_6465]EAJ5475477.1 ATP-binding protein [Campylobacter jejuni]EAL0241655.1 ATP-binding protein [Campylobacter jejuni]EAL0243417.1 ATP-binding protein [Campylobacter jejuni]ECR5191329.1 ATP-binding protein [Campylobacter jejuni]ECZ4078175.1 ATP-binding protein [Campylobacter jejuni]